MPDVAAGLGEAIIKGLAGTGIGGTIIGVLYGLSLLVKAWRDPSVQVATREAATLTTQLTALQAEMQGVKVQLEKVVAELERIKVSRQDMRYQRDQARIVALNYAMKLGEPEPTWPPDPEEEA